MSRRNLNDCFVLPFTLRVVLAIGIATILLGACSPNARDKLVVYSSGPRTLAEEICNAFENQTGVRVELFSATTGQIMAKVEAEKYNPRADVLLLAAETPAVGLKQAGRLHAYRPKGLVNPRPGWSDPENFYHATGAAAVGIAFREGSVDRTASWLSVLDRGVSVGSGRVAMPSPSRSGTAGDFLLALHALEPEGFWERFRTARQRNFEIVGANSQAITGLSIGAYDAVYCAADYIICREIDKGEALEVFFPDEGALFVLRPAVILASSSRKENAEKFLDHCFSLPVQEMIAGHHLIPAMEDVPLSDIRARFGIPTALAFDAAAAIKTQKELLRRFQYEVERAVIPQ
jgi:iron(III) transport system substrate-binding protein